MIEKPTIYEEWFDEAEPGEELNGLVAKHVMGQHNGHDVSDYSGTITSAMEVVERMTYMGFSAILGTSREYRRQWAEFFLVEDDDSEPAGAAYCCETLEMAICLAALRARGYSGESA